MRVGRVDDRFTYAPLVIKNHEVTEAGLDAATLRRVRSSDLVPSDVEVRDGLGLRATATVRRDVLLLDGATRILQAFGAADPSTRGALIDRNLRLWWLDLASPTLHAQQPERLRRVSTASASTCSRHSTSGSRSAERSPRRRTGTASVDTCEFSEHCQAELEAIDDVSLTRFTSLDQQFALRDTACARGASWPDSIRSAPESRAIEVARGRHRRRRRGSTRAKVRSPRRTDLPCALARSRQRTSNPRRLAHGLSDGRRRGRRRHGELRRRDVPLGRERHAEPTGRRCPRGLRARSSSGAN